MKKIIIYAVGGILAAFGVFGAIVCFLEIDGETADATTKIFCIGLAVIGIALVVGNLLHGKDKVGLDLLDKRRLKRLQSDRCPFCGKEMKCSEGGSYSSEKRCECPKNDLIYRVCRNGSYTLETDEKGKRKLVAHDYYPYVWLNKKEWDKECSTWTGNIPEETVETIRKVFDFAETVPKAEYGEDTPEFKRAEEAALDFQQGKCPFCKSKFVQRKKLIQGTPGYTKTEYEPGWIPSMGGGVWIKREVYVDGSPDRYETVTECSNACQAKDIHHEFIARAIAFSKQHRADIDEMLQRSSFKVKEKN